MSLRFTAGSLLSVVLLACIAAIGGELHVRYLVEGSLRRAATRVRVAVRLITSEDGFREHGRWWRRRVDRRGSDGSLPRLHTRLTVRAAAGRQCPIGCVVGSAFPMDVAAAEHSGWPNPLALTPFVMS